MAERGEVTFQGQPITHDLPVDIWTSAEQQRKYSRYRILTAQGLRRKTLTVNLAESWRQRHPDAASWVVKVLPERRTLERDLIASAGAVEPTISRVPIGLLDRDDDNAEECENYLEEWRKDNVPHQTFIEKGTEDGEYGVVCIPTAVDMDGCPDFYDRLDERAWDALDDEQKAEYQPDEKQPGKYAKLDGEGKRRHNPKYDRDARGKPKAKDAKDFTRDPDKSDEAHQKAVQRYLLKQEQGGVTTRVIPALDCAPFLVRGTKKDRWKLYALAERTLYYPEELIEQGYGWRGLGDRALIPQGFDATRTSGQNGMFYLYTLYLVHTDKDKHRRPIIISSVGGHPTYRETPRKGEEDLDGGVTLIDLYEQYGLEGAYWWYGGGMHTSDDDADFYYEPYMWPFVETILGIEGTTTMINAATSVNSTGGHFYRPDAELVGAEGVDPEALVDGDTGELRKPIIPQAGEIETVTGEVFPAQLATVTPDAWRVLANETASLKENTMLQQPSGAGASGHAQVVAETLGQTAKRHIRDGALDASKFCVESALKIFAALSKTYGINWPLQTTKERPVGSEIRTGAAVLEFNLDWIGDGEYRIDAIYPEEGNLAKVEQEASLAERGFGDFESVQAARGKPDAETEWAKVLKWRMRNSPEYTQMMIARLAKQQGNKMMLEVLSLQNQQRMTQQGPPGMDAGVPTAALRRAGEGGGATAAQQSRAGAISGEMGTQSRMADAQAQIQVGQGAAA